MTCLLWFWLGNSVIVGNYTVYCIDGLRPGVTCSGTTLTIECPLHQEGFEHE